jgi:hypothetical protein
MINTQRAYLTKEQVRAAQLDNRRRAFDEYYYEKANTPTLNEELERAQREEVRRAQYNPPLTEIWSGKSLNDLLQSSLNLMARGCVGPTVPLYAEALRSINVTTGAPGSGNQGLLKDPGPINWPIQLQTLSAGDTKPLRNQIDVLLTEARKQAGSGRIDAGTVVELEKDVDQLGKMSQAARRRQIHRRHLRRQRPHRRRIAPEPVAQRPQIRAGPFG